MWTAGFNRISDCLYSKKTLTIHEITTRQPIPDRYLEHIFTLLGRSGLLQSQRGAKGGYVLAREPWRIKVSEVIALIDGESSPSLHPSRPVPKTRGPSAKTSHVLHLIPGLVLTNSTAP
ncbi:MAG: Rrf2 family transcriptional regulator [Leptolyngbyaceae cyanobacterium bins.59]|nr:Rrf2 family transcriptional regulator [Leptolyngbyaceae cyanobacterium bins.59]